MKRWIGFLAGAALLVTIPTAVLASAGSTSSPVNRQQGVWLIGQISTSSKSFEAIPGLQTKVCAGDGEVSATVSLEGTGAPMGVLVRVDYGAVMQPGAIRFAPAGAADSTSFTFLVSHETFEGYDNAFFEVEWRSPSGAKTTLQRASMNLVYAEGTHNC
jgi:hypothetical protein